MNTVTLTDRELATAIIALDNFQATGTPDEAVAELRAKLAAALKEIAPWSKL